MKYVNEFRNAKALSALRNEILKIATRPWRIMEVCGGQTHSIVKYQLEKLLEPKIELIHGPGCPVCVTPQEVIDRAIRLSFERDHLVLSFGDMLRVPGRHQSLMEARAQGGSIDIVYSPLDAVSFAEKYPQKKVIFLAIGFETTSLPNALAALKARNAGLENFFLLSHHVRVPPAVELILGDPHSRVDGLLAAGHVCSVMGEKEYEPLVEKYQRPIVITGFEPVDILLGIRETVRQLEEGRFRLSNQYKRCVRSQGNKISMAILERVYKVGDQKWRGLGTLKDSGLFLSPEFSSMDADRQWPPTNDFQGVTEKEGETNGCQAAKVLLGSIKPPQCPHFRRGCGPQKPMGAPMVSSEGACAAYFQRGEA